MKFFLAVAALVAVSAAAPQFGSLHGSPVALIKTTEHRFIQEPTLLLRKEKAFTAEPSARALNRNVMAKEGAAEVLEQQMDMPEPGRYLYRFKTNNGIEMQEQAALEGDAEKVQGAYMWTSPEGKAFKIEYVADDMGFHPVGEHLPVAPEIPAAIQRSLEWNAAHPDEEARKWDSEEYVPNRVVLAKSMYA